MRLRKAGDVYTGKAGNAYTVSYKVTYTCTASEELFSGSWIDVPVETRTVVMSRGGIESLGCKGGGLPGEWCSDCPFAGRKRSEPC
jgi:hypothetical protein